MSKQSEAKKQQGYRDTHQRCGDCAHFRSEKIKEKYWIVEKNLRCGIGEFKVNKTAVCNMWAEKEVESV